MKSVPNPSLVPSGTSGGLPPGALGALGGRWPRGGPLGGGVAVGVEDRAGGRRSGIDGLSVEAGELLPVEMARLDELGLDPSSALHRGGHWLALATGAPDWGWL